MKAFITKSGNYCIAGYNKAAYFNQNFKLLKIISLDEFIYLVHIYKPECFDIKNKKRVNKSLRAKYILAEIKISTLNIEVNADFKQKVNFLNTFGETEYKLMTVSRVVWDDGDEIFTYNNETGSYCMESDVKSYLKKSNLMLKLTT